jgi:hypothetical protein
VAQHLGEEVDQVRREEHKTLNVAGNGLPDGTRHDWLRSRAATEPKDRRAFDELRKSGLQMARAWALNKTAMVLNSYAYERPEGKHIRWW